MSHALVSLGVVGAMSLVIIGFVVFQDTAANPTAAVQSEMTVGPVSVEHFATLADSGEYTVIDIRTPAEIALGKVTPDALELDYYASDFQSQLAALDRAGAYAIYCRSGNRTSDAVTMMKALGFTKVVELSGGKQAWERSGRTLLPGTDCGTATC